jgi:sec-independent protein translocase protein TatB
MSEVKSEVNRQMEMEEFRKIREESTAVLKEVENSIHSTAQEVTTHLSDQADLGLASSTSFDAVPNEQEVIRKTRRQGRNSWANKRAAKPLWFKRSSGIRARVQSGAARMKRFHHSASK